MEKNRLLRILPQVGKVLACPEVVEMKNRSSFSMAELKDAVQRAIEFERLKLIKKLTESDGRRKKSAPDLEASEPYKDGDQDNDDLMHRVLAGVERELTELARKRLCCLVNGTGIIIHTNLGRAPLGGLIEKIQALPAGYCNLEYNLQSGGRGSRYSHAAEQILAVTGGEDVLVVNNNAAAVFLMLNTMAKDRQVLVSRGELVEIGGSFRIPDIMRASGAILKEVGTTNKTRVSDFRQAIDQETALLLKVHRSNFAQVGFCQEVEIQELVELGQSVQRPVMFDLGSGSIFSGPGFDREQPAAPRYPGGISSQPEPGVKEVVLSGPDLVTFSGDKLLGGPQAGIIVGKKCWLDRVRQNPLLRVLRVDKLTLVILEEIFRLYREGEAAARKEIPVLAMLAASQDSLSARAHKLANQLSQISSLAVVVENCFSQTGGGSLPLFPLPSFQVKISCPGISEEQMAQKMRQNQPPIIGKRESGVFALDVRTILPGQISLVVEAAKGIAI